MLKFFCTCFIFFILSINAFAQAFQLTSTDFKPGKEIDTIHVFNQFGCTGKNISPELSWEGAPTNTKSFAVTMYDPDAPTDSGWWHWVVFNIPSNVNHLEAGAGDLNSKKLPVGAIQGQTDFGTSSYGGPCPPQGDKPHRYILTVYALKSLIPLDTKASGALVSYYIQQNKITSASLTSIYHR